MGLVAMTAAVRCRRPPGAGRPNGACSPTADSCRSTYSTPCNSPVAARRPTPATHRWPRPRHRCLPLDRVLDATRARRAPRRSLAGSASTARRTPWPTGPARPATPRGRSKCPVPDQHGPDQRRRLLRHRRGVRGRQRNPTASGTGSLANVSISLSLTSVLQSVLGGSLPAASSVCNGVPAATTSSGTNSNPLSPRCRACSTP